MWLNWAAILDRSCLPRNCTSIVPSNHIENHGYHRSPQRHLPPHHRISETQRSYPQSSGVQIVLRSLHGRRSESPPAPSTFSPITRNQKYTVYSSKLGSSIFKSRWQVPLPQIRSTMQHREARAFTLIRPPRLVPPLPRGTMATNSTIRRQISTVPLSRYAVDVRKWALDLSFC